MVTRREVLNILCSAARECYDDIEARQIAEMVLEAKGGLSRNAILVEPNVFSRCDFLQLLHQKLRAQHEKNW